MKSYNIVNFIKKIYIEFYIDTNSQNNEAYLISKDFKKKMEQFNQELHIEQKNLNYYFFEFKRYDVTDYIDDLDLCDNYLSFCTTGFKKSPAILLVVFFANEFYDEIRIEGKEILNNLPSILEFLKFQIIKAKSKHFN
ncbi:MAG: hypothetical protein KGD63_03355 [Candidatus Lokiarchaeota archaeon]|nr:hypothetical protein [Candidatus Lokiarchaeota archaeon]